MSYPSIAAILDSQKVNAEEASQEEMESCLYQAFEVDLNLGLAHLAALASRSLAASERILDIQNPNSDLGRQLIRLVGTNIARSICEKRLGVGLGLYNCCSVVVAPTRARLAMNPREQIRLQNGVLAHADC